MARPKQGGVCTPKERKRYHSSCAALTRAGRLATVGWAATLSGCGGALSTLDPAGPAAASIAMVWWWMLAVAALVLAGVTSLAAWTFRVRAEGRLSARGARRLIIAGGVALPTVAVCALLVYGLPAGQSMRTSAPPADVFNVELVAHQWWWEVIYPDVEGGRVVSANEIHIPAGRPVRLSITAADVIHSVWIPRLGGKVDAIPGHINVLNLQADSPGDYLGACAEFCGAQHARMRLSVTAHDEDELARRLARLAAPHPRADRLAAHADFRQQCLACHSIDARVAMPALPLDSAVPEDQRRAGPNLGNLPERTTLGAGTLTHTPEHLSRWLREHPLIKPGIHMPLAPLSRQALDDLANLLGTPHD